MNRTSQEPHRNPSAEAHKLFFIAKSVTTKKGVKMYERKEWGSSCVVDLSILTHNRLRGCVSCKKGESCGVESQGRKKEKKNGGDVATSREQFPANYTIFCFHLVSL